MSAPTQMTPSQFLQIVQVLRLRRVKLRAAYEIAEAIHKEFYGRRRYADYATFEATYYRGY